MEHVPRVGWACSIFLQLTIAIYNAFGWHKVICEPNVGWGVLPNAKVKVEAAGGGVNDVSHFGWNIKVMSQDIAIV
jgi:hypothetical protein